MVTIYKYAAPNYFQTDQSGFIDKITVEVLEIPKFTKQNESTEDIFLFRLSDFDLSFNLFDSARSQLGYNINEFLFQHEAGELLVQCTIGNREYWGMIKNSPKGKALTYTRDIPSITVSAIDVMGRLLDYFDTLMTFPSLDDEPDFNLFMGEQFNFNHAGQNFGYLGDFNINTRLPFPLKANGNLFNWLLLSASLDQTIAEIFQHRMTIIKEIFIYLGLRMKLDVDKTTLNYPYFRIKLNFIDEPDGTIESLNVITHDFRKDVIGKEFIFMPSLKLKPIYHPDSGISSYFGICFNKSEYALLNGAQNNTVERFDSKDKYFSIHIGSPLSTFPPPTHYLNRPPFILLPEKDLSNFENLCKYPVKTSKTYPYFTSDFTLNYVSVTHLPIGRIFMQSHSRGAQTGAVFDTGHNNVLIDLTKRGLKRLLISERIRELTISCPDSFDIDIYYKIRNFTDEFGSEDLLIKKLDYDFKNKEMTLQASPLIA